MCQSDTVKLKYPTAIRHYARGMALAGKHQLAQAKSELQQLEKQMADPDIAQLTIGGINHMTAILKIARQVLKAEILVEEGKLPSAIKLLREAVVMEDALNYQEPPDWFFSVRHHLGAALLKAKSYDEAASVFKDDLAVFPLNGWALAGLHQAQRNKGAIEEAQKTQTLLNEAWKWADKDLKSKSMNDF